MAKSARHSVRRARAPSARMAGAPDISPSHRWWNGITKAIVSIGAIAGAIGATLTLWPDPDPEDSARFVDVRVAEMPFSEYEQRTEARIPQGSSRSERRRLGPWVLEHSDDELAPPVEPDPDPSAESDPDVGTPTPESSPQSSSSPTPSGRADSSTPSSPTVSSPPPPGPADTFDRNILFGPGQLVVPPGLSDEEFSVLTDDVMDAVLAEPDIGCDTNACELIIAYIVVSEAVDAEGEPVSPDVAAERAIELLRSIRTTTDEAEPLGVVVTADVELAGLRGKEVFLRWSLLQTDGETRLPADWLSSNLAYRLEATTDRDTTTMDLWIPLPKATGSYFIQLELEVDGARLASADSPLFN